MTAASRADGRSRRPIARAAAYIGAGTVEFLSPRDARGLLFE